MNLEIVTRPDLEYPYRTTATHGFEVEFPTNFTIDRFARAVSYDGAGWVSVRRGYAWDGPSGPALDTVSFMRASLLHDVLYQALREGADGFTRADADRAMYHEAVRCGMWRVRALWCWAAVRLFAGRYARP